MKNFKLIVLVSAFVLSACGGTTAVKQEPKSMQAETPAKQASEPMQKQAQAKMSPNLNDAQLKSLLVGKTIFGDYKGKIWEDPIGSDGTMENRFDGKLMSKGVYTINNNMYCRTRYDTGNKSCWTIRKRTNDYLATPVSGTTNSFEFRVK